MPELYNLSRLFKLLGETLSLCLARLEPLPFAATHKRLAPFHFAQYALLGYTGSEALEQAFEVLSVAKSYLHGIRSPSHIRVVNRCSFRTSRAAPRLSLTGFSMVHILPLGFGMRSEVTMGSRPLFVWRR